MPPPPLPIAELLARARREVLSDVEREELEESTASSSSSFSTALNPRNEAAALSALYAPLRLARDVEAGGGDAEQRKAELDALAASYVRRTGGPEEESKQQITADVSAVDEATAALAAWALEEGSPTSAAAAAVAPALFSDPSRPQRGQWRGLVATRDLAPGDVALTLPLAAPQDRHLAITYASARSSDFGRALSALPGLDDESLALLFTLADRHDPDSPHSAFWRALPQETFGTPLGSAISDAAIQHALGGTNLGQRCVEARKHLEGAYAALLPRIAALVKAYPQHLKPGWFSRASFLWAAELWYAYSMQVQLPESEKASSSSTAAEKRAKSAKPPPPCPALVPLASLANHSLWPHAVAYSDCSGDGAQRVRVFRPVKKGEEFFISYGAHANDELLLFYGFAVEGEGGNPFDARAVGGQLRRQQGGAGEKEWRAAHEAALQRVEEALSAGGSDGRWTEREREFFEQARVFLLGFLRAEAALKGRSGGD